MSEQDLALALLRRAVLDAQDPKLPDAKRRGARRFLTGHDPLDFWASVAGLDAERVRAHARRL